MSGAFVLAAGGTGGHLFPAEALAAELLGGGGNVHLLSDARAEAFAGRVADIETHYVRAAQLGGGAAHTAHALGELALGTLQARRLLRRLYPACVVGFGGYASVPTMLAAVSLGLPTVIHEQNAVLGRANRLLAPRVRRIATGFPAVVLFALIVTYLPNGPQDAQFINEREKSWLASELARGEISQTLHTSPLRVLLDWRVWAFSAAYSMITLSLYCVIYWLPTVVKGFGATSTQNGLLNSLPWAMKPRGPARCHDQPPIRGLRKGRDRALDLPGVAHVDRVDLHSERWRHGLNGSKLAGTRALGRIPKDHHSCHAWRDLLE